MFQLLADHYDCKMEGRLHRLVTGLSSFNFLRAFAALSAVHAQLKKAVASSEWNLTKPVFRLCTFLMEYHL